MAAKKSGLLKKIILIAAGLAVLAVGALAGVIHFVDWDKAKDKGTAYLSKTLKHKVSIESIKAGLFTGVRLNKLRIANADGFGPEPLFYNEEARLSISLLSLFTGKLVVSEIEFKGPKVFVVKDAKGRFNFSDMTASEPKAKARASKEDEGSSSAPPVVIASFRLSGGELKYRDLKKGTIQSVKGLDILLKGLSLKAGGSSRLEIKFTAETEGKKIPVEMSSNFSVDLAGQKLGLKSFDLKLPSLSASASGTVSKFQSQPEVDIKAEILAKLDSLVADLAPPSALKGMPEGLKTNGAIRLKVAAKGKAAKPESLDLSLLFESVGLKYGSNPAIEGMNGELKVGSTKASLPALDFKMGGSPVSLKLEAKNYSLANLMGPTDKMRMNLHYELNSPKLVLDPLVALGGPEEKASSGKAKASAAAPNGGLVDYRKLVSNDLSIDGKIKVDAMQLKEMKLGKFSYDMALAKRKFKAEADLDLFDGHFWAVTTADLSVPGPGYAFKSSLKKMQLEKFITSAARSFPEKKLLKHLEEKVYGSLFFEASGKGRGIKAPATTKNIDLSGSFQLLDGKVKKLDVQEHMASAIPHAPTQAALRKDLDFGQMLADFSLKSEVMKLGSFEMSSGKDRREGELLVQASGQMKLGGAANFRIVPHFNPRLVKLEGALQDAFADDKGWATYDPIVYAGPTLDAAKASFTEGAKNAATKVVKKEATKLVEEKGKDLIKQLPGGLQNLFGK